MVLNLEKGDSVYVRCGGTFTRAKDIGTSCCLDISYMQIHKLYVLWWNCVVVYQQKAGLFFFINIVINDTFRCLYLPDDPCPTIDSDLHFWIKLKPNRHNMLYESVIFRNDFNAYLYFRQPVRQQTQIVLLHLLFLSWTLFWFIYPIVTEIW